MCFGLLHPCVSLPSPFVGQRIDALQQLLALLCCELTRLSKADIGIRT
jgi:hypothetical protein